MKLAPLLKTKGFTLDIETTSESGTKDDNTNPLKNDIICIGFYSDETGSIVLTKREVENEMKTFKKLMSKDYLKVGHCFDFDFATIYHKFGVRAEGLWFDTYTAQRNLDENVNSNKLEELSLLHLCVHGWKFNYNKKHTEQEWMELCGHDIKHNHDLAKVMSDKLLEEGLYDIFRLDMQVEDIFLDSRCQGIKIDVKLLEELESKFIKNELRTRNYITKLLIREGVESIDVDRVKKGEPYIEEILAEDINFSSPQQMMKLMYESDLDIPPQYKYVKGQKKLTTEAKFMVKLARDGYKFPRWLMFYRRWEKLAGTCRSLINDSVDGRIYPMFDTNGAVTGRFSEKLLQCIPSRAKEGLRIRYALMGDLTVADYSNVELRILAHFTEDPGLMGEYVNGKGDVHTKTKNEFAKLGVEMTRGQAKTCNFAIGYGISARELAGKMNTNEAYPWRLVKSITTEDQAQEFIDTWYDVYPLVKQWQTSTIEECEIAGFVTSVMGRKRRISFEGLSRKNRRDYGKIAAAEREACNAPIQTTSADITKLAIVELRDQNNRLQIHDEVVLDGASKSKEEIKEIMDNVIKLRLPIPVDIQKVKRWGDAKD